jgi:hypothetical protein
MPERPGTYISLAPDLAPPPFEQTRLPAVAATTRPVRPLRSPVERALLLLLVAVVAGTCLLLLGSLRPNLAPALSSGPAALELLAGFAAFLLAMRLTIPGWGASAARAGLLIAGVLGVALAAALAAPHLVPAWLAGPSVGAPGPGLRCLGLELSLGLPALLLGVLLVVRGARFASAWSGALVGLGAALVGDATMHLHCPVADPRHTVVYHLGAMVLLVAAGAVAGAALRRAAAGTPRPS